MRTLFAKVVLFIELLVTLNANQEAMPVNIAQKIYETTVIEEITEAKEDLREMDFSDYSYENIDVDIRLTWLDNNTCIKEYIISIDDNTIGMDSIIDIDEYGEVDEETQFRWFIGDESYADEYTWEDNFEMLYGCMF